ncbi:unnamed protein product [Peniophora sp. CBMAI 1063]|nr:unnamed protein product [Peniophora sp. CBMAI 1063]
MPEEEFRETIMFEWRLRDLKSLFDASTANQKSQVIKSSLFGNGQWQILLYTNSGLGSSKDPASGTISLFLSCEPTMGEKQAADGSDLGWVREGAYGFTFEILDINKTEHIVTKEARNHHFSQKTANWGWAQFASRESVFYSRPSIRREDALLLMCKVEHEATTGEQI